MKLTKPVYNNGKPQVIPKRTNAKSPTNVSEFANTYLGNFEMCSLCAEFTEIV